MLVSHRHKFIYFKTHKTGGTTIEAYFEPYCINPSEPYHFSHARTEYVSDYGIIGARGSMDFVNSAKYRNHMSAQSIEKAIGSERFQQYYKFCAIRNPFDQMVSCFYFRRQPKKAEWIGRIFSRKKRTIDLISEFRNWVYDNRNKKIIDDTSRFMIDGKICVDYFIRHEDFNRGIQEVCSKTGIPFEEHQIKKLKGGLRDQSIGLQEFYDKQTLEIISDMYSLELDYFGYSALE